MAKETLQFGAFKPSVETLRRTYELFSAQVAKDARVAFENLKEAWGDVPETQQYIDEHRPGPDSVVIRTHVELEVDHRIRVYSNADEALGHMQAEDWTSVAITWNNGIDVLGFDTEWNWVLRQVTVQVGGEGKVEMVYPDAAVVAAVLGPLSEAFNASRKQEPRTFWPRVNMLSRHPIVVGIVLAFVGYLVGKVT